MIYLVLAALFTVRLALFAMVVARAQHGGLGRPRPVVARLIGSLLAACLFAVAAIVSDGAGLLIGAAAAMVLMAVESAG